MSSVIRPSENRPQHRGRSSIRRAIFTRSWARRSDTPAFHCTQCSSDLIPWPRQPSAASSDRDRAHQIRRGQVDRAHQRQSSAARPRATPPPRTSRSQQPNSRHTRLCRGCDNPLTRAFTPQGPQFQVDRQGPPSTTRPAVRHHLTACTSGNVGRSDDSLLPGDGRLRARSCSSVHSEPAKKEALPQWAKDYRRRGARGQCGRVARFTARRSGRSTSLTRCPYLPVRLVPAAIGGHHALVSTVDAILEVATADVADTARWLMAEGAWVTYEEAPHGYGVSRCLSLSWMTHRSGWFASRAMDARSAVRRSAWLQLDLVHAARIGRVNWKQHGGRTGPLPDQLPVGVSWRHELPAALAWVRSTADAIKHTQAMGRARADQIFPKR